MPFKKEKNTRRDTILRSIILYSLSESLTTTDSFSIFFLDEHSAANLTFFEIGTVVG